MLMYFSFVSTFVFVMFLGAPPLLAIELLCASYAISLQKCYKESYDAIITDVLGCHDLM